jgi:hypothetical protein
MEDYHSNMFDFFGVELEPLAAEASDDSERMNRRNGGPRNRTTNKYGKLAMMREQEKVLDLASLFPICDH